MTRMTVWTTDRERLVLALDELASNHGYLVANPSDLHCCGTCLADWMDGVRPRSVGWHSQSDEQAFGHGFPAIDWPDIPRADVPVCARCTELLDWGEMVPDGDDDAYDAYDQWRAAQYDHVLTDHHQLIGTLALRVNGDRRLVAAVLRRHGLQARPRAEADWVEVTGEQS